MKREYKYLFGPVPSRRLGWSMGVDLTPFKTCTLDCVFCQLGHTTRKTAARCEYVSTLAVKREIAAWIKKDGKADFITLAGSGEPTLHTRFGEIIDFIHGRSDIPVALMTNGTTLAQPDVRDGACRADVVKVTLSAWNEELFQEIHRPCAGVTLRRLLDGERALRRVFRGQLWVEVFLMQGVNSTTDDVRRLAELVRTLKPDRVQLNTAIRPPAEPVARALTRFRLETLARLFDPPAEVIAAFHSRARPGIVRHNERLVLGLLRRRPCTAMQIAGACNLHGNACAKYLGRLLRRGAIHADHTVADVYYTATIRQQTACSRRTTEKRQRPVRLRKTRRVAGVVTEPGKKRA
jgi:wyosine [tRNA(Phe)-imidazoG37] synthetase (radical SAM superfamily)